MDKLDNIKADYKYEIKGKWHLEFVFILGDFRDHLNLKIKNANLNKDFTELKEKIQKKKKSIDIENIEKDLDEIITEYNNIKEELKSEYEYYLIILSKLSFNYYNENYNVKGAKEIFFNSSKQIIDNIVISFINKEKKLIMFKDKIKDLTKLLI